MYPADRFITPRDENWPQIVSLYSYPTEDSVLKPQDDYSCEIFKACNGFDYKEDRRWLFPFQVRKSPSQRSVGKITALGSHMIKPYLQSWQIEQKLQRANLWKAIPKEAERVLDAPNFSNDFYLSLLDASTQGDEQVAIALGQSLYTYVPSSSHIEKQRDACAGSQYTMVRWLNRPGSLLVGENLGGIHQINVESKVSEWNRQFAVESMYPICAEPVGMHSMVVGFKSGAVFQLDSREPKREKLIGTAMRNSSVCALRLHANDTYLASGSNDNLVRLWDVRRPRQEVLRIEDHLAAVKGLAWSPVSSDLLFSGGGTADRTIKVTSLKAQKVIASESSANCQITGIHFSKDGTRLATCHGYSRNSVIIWQYNGKFKQIAELTGHKGRILGSSMLQDRTTLLTASEDETLRFWNVFSKVKDEEKKLVFRSEGDYCNQATSKLLASCHLR